MNMINVIISFFF
jgi:kinesin family member C2/C3